MSLESVAAPPAVIRRTADATTFPPWVVGVLVLGAILLGVASLIDDKSLMLVAGGLTALVGGATIFYRPHVGVLVILSTMLLSYPEVLKGVPPFTINNMLGGVLLVILVLQLYRSRDYWFLRQPEVRLLIFLTLWLILIAWLSELYLPEKRLLPSIARRGVEGKSYGEADDTGRWIFELLSRLAFVIFFLNWMTTPTRVRWALWLFALCIAAAVPTLGPDMTKGENEYRITSKAVGWAVNLNRFAFMMNVGVALFLYLAGRTRALAGRLFFILCALGSIPLILLSASRSGFIGLGMVGLFSLGVAPVPRRWKGGVALAGLALTLLAFQFVLADAARERLLNINPFAPQASADYSAYAEGSRSTEVRMTTLAEAFEIIARYPLTGVGLANFRWVNAIMHESYKPPHNSYVWAAAEGGLPALFAYLALFALLWGRISRMRPHFEDHPILAGLPDWLRIYLILLLFFSMFADVWIEVHVYLIAAIAITLSRIAEDEYLRTRGLPGAQGGTAGARRASARALYRQDAAS